MGVLKNYLSISKLKKHCFKGYYKFCQSELQNKVFRKKIPEKNQIIKNDVEPKNWANRIFTEYNKFYRQKIEKKFTNEENLSEIEELREVEKSLTENVDATLEAFNTSMKNINWNTKIS